MKFDAKPALSKNRLISCDLMPCFREACDDEENRLLGEEIEKEIEKAKSPDQVPGRGFLLTTY